MQIIGWHLMDQKLAWSLGICFAKPSSGTRHAEVLSTSELCSGTVVITTLQPLELSQEMRWFSSLGASSLPWESEQVKFLHEFFLLMVCLLLWPICKCYSEYIFIYHVSDII